MSSIRHHHQGLVWLNSFLASKGPEWRPQGEQLLSFPISEPPSKPSGSILRQAPPSGSTPPRPHQVASRMLLLSRGLSVFTATCSDLAWGVICERKEMTLFSQRSLSKSWGGSPVWRSGLWSRRRLAEKHPHPHTHPTHTQSYL